MSDAAGPAPPDEAFACPRCGRPVTDEYYGPCDGCRQELRTTMAGERREIEATEYEPKMNVVPNQVATKD